MALANPVLSNEAFERAAREGPDSAATTVGGTYVALRQGHAALRLSRIRARLNGHGGAIMQEYLTTPSVGRRRCQADSGSICTGCHTPGHGPRGACRHGLGAVVRPRAISTFVLVAVLALVGAGFMPMPAAVQAQGGAQPAASQQTAGPMPRPELAVGLRDLPPGSAPAPSRNQSSR